MIDEAQMPAGDDQSTDMGSNDGSTDAPAEETAAPTEGGDAGQTPDQPAA